ncbi:MAG: acetolactate synthase small subunit [Candidatus Rokuibacteriota bacterium]|nr:MAG: acetolactate synthase small subunit [Candidatus Rokubacteria bacterium]
MKKHTIAVLVENRFGVLSRVAGLFSARGYNIESLSVGETLDPAVSRMTLVVRGDAFVIEQVMKQLHKLIDRAKVIDVTAASYTLEVTGEESKIEAMLELLRAFGIQEVVRTGKVAIARSPKTRLRRAEEKLGKTAPPRPSNPAAQDPRVVGFAD